MCEHQIKPGLEYVVGIRGPEKSYIDIYGVRVVSVPKSKHGEVLFEEMDPPHRRFPLGVDQVYNEGRGPLSLLEIHPLKPNER
jgi:hypothetical protein